nr:hypothetical protein [uncultured Oscillibacter sp.]
MNILNASILPGALTTYKQGDVSREMERVFEATGDASFYPDKSAPTSISNDGEKVELTYEQRQDFQRDRGATLMLTMSDMIGTSAYKAASETDKDDLLNLCYRLPKCGLNSGPVVAQRSDKVFHYRFTQSI